MRAVLPSLLLIALLTLPASAVTLLVNPDGSGDYTTILAAMNAASDGDTILLGDGTFTGGGNRDISYMGKDVVIRSKSGNPATCIIDCSGLHGFTFTSGETSNSRLEYVTIKNAYDHEGGAIYCVGTWPKIIGCVFSGCNGTYGAAIYGRNAHAMEIRDCAFIGNSATIGGAIFLKTSSGPQIRDCLFQENNAAEGGAVGCWEGGTSPDMTNCSFIRNSTNVTGGAILAKEAYPTMNSCTFTDNSSPVGGGLYVRAGSNGFVSKCIVAFSTVGTGLSCESSTSGILVSCSDIYGNAGGDWVGCIAGQAGTAGNFSKDPLFCDRIGGDLTLRENSPCVDAPTCGQVGAFGAGCGASGLSISSTVPSCPIPTGGVDSPYPAGTVFQAIGGCPPYAWSQTGLPEGMDIDNVSGEIIGTPVVTGQFSFEVTVADECDATDSRSCSVTIEEEPLLVDATTPSCPISQATLDMPYPAGTIFTATGGVPPYTWSQTGLPSGMTIDPVTGEIEGTPGVAGTFAFVVQVEDAVASTANRPCSVTVVTEAYALIVDDAPTALGLDLDLPILGSSTAPLRAYSVVVRFDPAVFTLRPGVFDTTGTATVGAEIIVQSATDSTVQVGVIYSFDCPPQIDPGTQTLLKLLLRTRDHAPVGPTVVELVDLPPSLNRMTTCDGFDRAPTLMAGEVTVYASSFIRGDCNSDGVLTIDDPLLNLAYQFVDGELSCLDAADLDDNGVLSISDPSYALNYQFGDGPEPPFPFDQCGPDATEDDLECACDPYCMDCFPVHAVQESSISHVSIALGAAVLLSENTVGVPVVLETNAPLWGFEYTVTYAGDVLAFEDVEASGFDFASGKEAPEGGSVRIGQVVDFSLMGVLPPGGHDIGMIRFTRLGAIENANLQVTEGRFVQAGGSSGSIEPSVSTGVGAEELPAPTRAVLSLAAMPNPFNPTVSLAYTVPRAGPVTLRIYDASGRLVATLLDETRPAGAYTTAWTGQTDSGERTPSGIYFCRVTAGDEHLTKKIVLVR